MLASVYSFDQRPTQPTGRVTVVGRRSQASWVIAFIEGTSMIPIEFQVNMAYPGFVPSTPAGTWTPSCCASHEMDPYPHRAVQWSSFSSRWKPVANHPDLAVWS